MDSLPAMCDSPDSVFTPALGIQGATHLAAENMQHIVCSLIQEFGAVVQGPELKLGCFD